MMESARVIVGVDGSHSSLGVVRRAAVEARKRDALLVPVIAWRASDDEALRPFSELRHSARGRLDTVLELAFDGLPTGVRTQPLVLRGEPGRALVATADRGDDLLVVGSGRPGPARQIVHGPVTRHCWTHAVCEVLIVPRATPVLPAGFDLAAEPVPHCHAGFAYEN
ncbi:universal stress protein [Streptacidiphilus sp. 4-A2]|nr:universal stress protein [Streptacidiphilus sp. 4-A2]